MILQKPNATNGAVKVGATNGRSYNGALMKAGRAGEEIVLDWLRSRPYIQSVADLRDHAEMRHADIDCSITANDGRILLAEIKSDWYMGISGKVLFEVLRINHTAPPERAATLGWSARSPATTLFYYAPQVGCIYQCSFGDLRQSFQKYTHEARKQTNISIVETDAIKTTINILVPMSYCESIFKIHRLTDVQTEVMA